MNENPNEFYNYIPQSFDIWCMKQVYLVAERSKDPSTKIGAVLVKDGNIIGTGYNGFARKVLDLPERYNDRETKYSYVVHAEDNVVLTCARLGTATLNSTLYTQSYPCNSCMKSIIQGGIIEIVLHSMWPMSHSKWEKLSDISKIMVKETGIRVRYIDDILNVMGYVDGKKIEV